MDQRRIGDDLVGEIGLGCMGMSFAYGPADEQESLRVLDRALELGVNHWDTADLYGMGANEELLATALAGRRDDVFLATKFGNVFDRSLTSHQDLVAAQAGWIVDGTPAYARACLEASLTRLGVDHVDLFYLHRVDDRVPIEETVGAMADLVGAGKTRYIGLSEVVPDTLRRAHAVHPITAVQNEFSLWTRDYAETVLPVTAELGIAFVPYSPLGRGFLTGTVTDPEQLDASDWRRHNPRFQGDNFEANLRIVEVVRRIADTHDATPAQVALAWVLAQGESVLPIPGTKRVRYLEQNAAAAEVELTSGELAELDQLGDGTGLRYPEASMDFVAR
ncbi:MAG: aldo/keto reductase [Actinobacteria bacterium]|nr:MAG: aldo/keto reductase [Actinomycetota bacterium]